MFDKPLSSSQVPLKIESYERWTNSPEYYNTLTLVHLLLSTTICKNNIVIKKYLILNSKYATIASILKQLERQVMVTSSTDLEYYFTPAEFQTTFRILDWHSDIMKINYNPHCIIDFYLDLPNQSELDSFKQFTIRYRLPILLLLINSSFDREHIISQFNDIKYDHDDTSVNYIQNHPKANITEFNLNSLFVFIPRIEECQEPYANQM